MSRTICYFTATGNCLYVARKIGGTLLSIPQLMRKEDIVIEDESVGVVCPVYNAEMPMMVRDFMRRVHIKTNYFFFVYTYGAGFDHPRLHQLECLRYFVPMVLDSYRNWFREKAMAMSIWM